MKGILVAVVLTPPDMLSNTFTITSNLLLMPFSGRDQYGGNHQRGPGDEAHVFAKQCEPTASTPVRRL
jgi:hypothetical protein